MTEPHPLPDSLLEILADLPLEQLAFSPVPVKPRHDGWTVARQRGFILRLAVCGCVSAAARGEGMSAHSAYTLRRRPDATRFAASWDKALGWGVDRTTDVAIERALVGEVRPVYYRGRRIGERVVHDNRLAIAVLGRLERAARLRGTRGRRDVYTAAFD